MASKRLQILQAIETKLKTIVAGATYNTTPKVVTYEFIPLERVSEFPTICLMPLDVSYVPLVNNEYTSGLSRNSTDGWPIEIRSYTKNDVSEEAQTLARENMIEDIAICILADHTLGLPTFVNNAYYKSAASILDTQRSISINGQVFDIKYDFTKGAP